MNGIEKENKFIPELIIEHIQHNGVYFITSLPQHQQLTINDVVKYCTEEGVKLNRNNIDFKKLILDAISAGYDKRYYAVSEKKDERFAYADQFMNAFTDILKQLNIFERYKHQNTIVVGIGNGTEGKILYRDIKKLVVVDIAPNSLKRAQEVLPQAEVYQAEANKLYFIPDAIFELYISLRTYQSTYFDIFASLQEAKRILKNKGAIIISIACGYLEDNGKLVYGLYNPHSGLLEKSRPIVFLNYVNQYLNDLGFEIVDTKIIPTEIFIYAINHNY